MGGALCLCLPVCLGERGGGGQRAHRLQASRGRGGVGGGGQRAHRLQAIVVFVALVN